MQVTWTGSKEVKTKFGPKKTYSMKGDDGNFYSFGFKDPGVEKGDSVEFEFDNDMYGNKVRFESIKITKASGATAAPSASSEPKPAFRGGGGFGRPEKVFPIPLMHGDRSIIRQNSLGHACELITNGIGYDASLLNDVEKAADAVIKLARRFEMYSAGDEERLSATGKTEEASEVEVEVAKAVANRKGK